MGLAQGFYYTWGWHRVFAKVLRSFRVMSIVSLLIHLLLSLYYVLLVLL